MDRQGKQAVIDAVKADFEGAQASFIVATHGMDVVSIQSLRSQIFEKNGSMKVVKNTLLKRATSDLPGMNGLEPFFKEQIAVVFAKEEVPAIAKILYDASEKGALLKLMAGTLDAKVISSEQIVFLANLPSREVLLAKVCGTLQAPIANYVILLNQLIARFVRVLKEIERTKS